MTAWLDFRRLLGVAVAVAATLALPACTTPATPQPSSTGLLTPDAAAQILRTTVKGAKPLLILNAIPADWRAGIQAESNAFSVTYYSPRGEKSIGLVLAVTNPPPPGANATQTSPSFHGDARSLYQVADGRDPLSDRLLLWSEPGTWAQPGPGGVPYLLTGKGLTDAEFWSFASSLHPNQI